MHRDASYSSFTVLVRYWLILYVLAYCYNIPSTTPMKTNQTNSITNGMISGIVELNEWRLLELVCWWVMGAAAPRQPAHKEDQQRHQSNLFLISFYESMKTKLATLLAPTPSLFVVGWAPHQKREWVRERGRPTPCEWAEQPSTNFHFMGMKRKWGLIGCGARAGGCRQP